MDVGRIWAFLGCGISWVCCSCSAEKTRVPSFVLPDSRPSHLLPLRPPRKKLTVLLHAIGKLALCRFYSKTIALRTPVSLSFQFASG